MSRISKLKIDKKVIEIPYPEMEEFVVQLCYLSRSELAKIRNKSLKIQFNKITRQREEVVDDDKFLRLYADQAVVGWTGFKVKHLPELLPVNISNELPEEEIPYSQEEAYDLLRHSVEFDRFITDCMADLNLFNSEKEVEEEKN